ncbi:Afadin and alpha-actinin-binding-domain-containing protein [Podospora didyma]|uniref:Afadin and alpha-actinin-binding-domain-containing protein n=1 Tax=Podospora didyma TaxID=330526 RepID=A0AAE0N4B4_9PEZI|nr:Afadin and alpha-actinin-binding-domain-containing protein [Podospora didyma]
MIESENLRTASLYINNQLLSRGLLRDGQTIDFTHPGDSHGEVAATMSRVMAVVNDLILRRDRDAEHREALATTLRTLRAESLRQANDIQRLQEKHAESQRKAALHEAAEVALQSNLKVAEATIQRLKEEAARIKTLAAQTKTACANEVRKRDRQIEGLRKAVVEAGRARGSGKNSSITTISVTGDIGHDADQGATTAIATNPSGDGYDLRLETNSFLAELAKSLSEENETLLGLVRRTTEHLKEMSGWDAAGTPERTDGHALALPASCQEMATEIEGILSHLRTILTNPSFVPIEEVVVREDEIHRLRDGWEKMETRWKEAVHLIDGWRRRMQVSGRPVNVEELKMGLRLSPVRVQNVEETTQGLGLRLPGVTEDLEEPSMMHSPSPAERLHLVPAPELEDADDSDCASSIFVDDLDVDELDVEEPNVEILQQSTMLDSPPLPEPPQLSPLRDSYTVGNRGGGVNFNPRKRAGDFTTIVEENTWELKDEAPLPPPHLEKPQESPKKKRVQQPLRPVPQQQENLSPLASADLSASESSLDSILLVKPQDDSSSKKPAATATTTRSRGRISPITGPRKQQDREVASSGSRKPATAAVPTAKRLPRSNTVTRSRTQSRQDETENQPLAAKQPTRTVSAASNAASDTSTTTATTTTTNSGSSSVATDAPLSKPSLEINTSMLPPPTPSQFNRSPRRVNSRLPLPRTGGNNILPPPQQSPLSMATIAAKLAASEREADAARVRAKLKAARGGLGGSGGSGNGSGGDGKQQQQQQQQQRKQKRVSLAPPATGADASGADIAARSTRSEGTVMPEEDGVNDEDEEDELAGPPPPPSPPPQEQQIRKRERRTSRVASRRRSTLNPWELGALIQGTVGSMGSSEQED